MKNFINPRQPLKMLAAVGTIGLLAVSQATSAQDKTYAEGSKRTNAQASTNKDGDPIWDMAFVAIDTNDNNTVEWSEISRHYVQQLSNAGWGEDEVLNRFDRNNDNVLDENEYVLFVGSLEENIRTSMARQNSSESMNRTQQAQKSQQNRQSAASNTKQRDNQQQQAARQQGKSSSASAAKQDPKRFAVKEGDKSAAGNFSADELMDMNVVGRQGEEIGSVENLLINQQGQIVAVIAEVGGFFDIGDTHVAVPWEQASMKNGNLHLPITKDNASNYSIFKEQYFSTYDVGTKITVDDELSTGPEIWKASDLINDYVLLESDTGYGYVTDLTFNRNGKLQSVVVNASNPDFGYGYYAYPWYGFGYDFGWDPGLNYYTLPYSDRDLVGL